MPALNGWSVRDHNLYFNIRRGNCPSLQAGESCNKLNPQFVNQPANPYINEPALDNFNFTPSSASPLIGAGIAIPSVLTDSAGLRRPARPVIGAIEFNADAPTGKSTADSTRTEGEHVAWYRQVVLYFSGIKRRWILPVWDFLKSQTKRLLHLLLRVAAPVKSILQ
jgi:hypothetical protein